MADDQDLSKTDLLLEQVSKHLKNIKKTSGEIDQVTQGVMSRYNSLVSQAGLLGTLLTKQTTPLIATNRQLALMDAKIKSLSKSTDEFDKANLATLKFARAVAIPVQNLTSALSNPAAKAAILMWKGFWNNNRELADSLRDANYDLTLRNTLIQTGFGVIAKTGVSVQTLVSAQKSLVGLGAEGLSVNNDINSQYGKMLKTVVLMHDALGLSTDEGARLLMSARTSNIEFTKLANTIAEIVDHTSIAANEAARYAKEIMSAQAIVTGGRSLSAGGSQDSLRVISQLSGAIKSSGIGDQEDISALVSRMSDFTKQGGLGVQFGSGGVDFSQSGERTGKLLNNIGKLLDQMSGGSGVGLTAIAEMLKIKPETAAIWAKTYREQQKVFSIDPRQREEAELQEKYSKQLAVSGKIYGALWQQIKGLVSSALMPLMGVLVDIASVIGSSVSYIVSKIAEWKGAVMVLGAGITLGLIVTMSLAAKAAWSLTASLAAMAMQMRINAASAVVGGSAGSLSKLSAILIPVGAALSRAIPFLGTVGNFIVRLFPAIAGLARFAGPVGWIVSIAASLLPLLWPYIKKLFTGGKDEDSIANHASEQGDGISIEQKIIESVLRSKDFSKSLVQADRVMSDNGFDANQITGVYRAIAERERDTVYAASAGRQIDTSRADDRLNEENRKLQQQSMEHLANVVALLEEHNKENRRRSSEVSKANDIITTDSHTKALLDYNSPAVASRRRGVVD